MRENKSKYDRIPEFLEGKGGDRVEATIEEIDRAMEAVGGLPPSARQYQEWWANNKASSAGRQCHRWMRAGWRAYPKMNQGKVIRVLFKRHSRPDARLAAHIGVGSTRETAPPDLPVPSMDPGERLKIEITLEDRDIPLWLMFRHQGGNSSQLFATALRSAVEDTKEER